MSEQYLYNPQLPIVRKGWNGNYFYRGKFENEVAAPPPNFLTIAKWQWGRRDLHKERRKDTFRLPIVRNTQPLHETSDCLIWLGHATFFIRLAGVTFLTDPCFFDLPLVPRLTDLPFEIAAIPRLDYVLLSHAHRDHLDNRSLKTVLHSHPQVEFLLPLCAANLLKNLPVKHKQEAGWYQQYHINCRGVDLEVFYTPALHWHKRGLTDFNKVLWGSFYIRNSHKSVFFAGDTGYAPHFNDIRKVLGCPNVCLLPVGAYSPRQVMQYAHVNPEEAVQAFNDLGGQVFVPMHYGTYDLSDEPLGEPIEKLQHTFVEPTQKGILKIPAIGEPLYF